MNGSSEGTARFRWYLYDAGNTIVELAVSLRLFAFVAGSTRVSPEEIGAVYALSTWLATALGLPLGALLDRTRNPLQPLRALTFASAFFIGLLPFLPEDRSALLLLCVGAGNLTFVLGALTYTSMMRSIAGRESVLAVSGRGVAASYVGSLSAILIWMLLDHTFLRNLPRSFVFLYSGVLYLVAALPLLFHQPPPRPASVPDPLPSRSATAPRKFLVYFLLGALLLTAGMHGVALNLVTFLGGRGLMSDVVQIIWGAGAVAVIAGAAAVGILGRRIMRKPHAWLLAMIFLWALAVGALAFARGVAGVLFAVLLAGASTGALQSSLRGEFAAVTSRTRQGLGFGTFFLFQRIGQGVGPLCWAVLQNGRAGPGITPAPLVMSGLALAGAALLVMTTGLRSLTASVSAPADS